MIIEGVQTTNDFFWFETQYSPIKNKSSETIGVMFIARDITDKKNAELKNEIYVKDLENLNQTKDKFFSIIAHDLRNPFAGILGLSSILQNRLAEDGNYPIESITKIANLIEVSAKSAFNLLENLMQWARSQTGDIQFKPIITSANALLDNVLSTIIGLVYNKNIQIETSLEPDTFIAIDPELTNTILRNLITNAIKFTSSGGKIKISSQTENKMLLFCVEDSGVGIQEENISKLFRIDSKYSKLGTNGEKGTGLGLILCKEFVEKQGGEIWAESEFGNGSKFFFSVPLAI